MTVSNAQKTMSATQILAKRPVQNRPAPKDKIPARPFVLLFIFTILAAVVVTFTFFMIDEASLIKKKVTVEVGTSASFDMFLEGEPKYPQYLSTNLDFKSVDYSVPQSVFFVITLYGIDTSSAYIHLDVTDDQVYISSSYAEKYRLNAGDTITLKAAKKTGTSVITVTLASGKKASFTERLSSWVYYFCCVLVVVPV